MQCVAAIINNLLWVKLCNKYGLFLVDEANIESHGMGAELQGSFDKTKHPAYYQNGQRLMDRNYSLVLERDKALGYSMVFG
jgi:beta-galactosidase